MLAVQQQKFFVTKRRGQPKTCNEGTEGDSKTQLHLCNTSAISRSEYFVLILNRFPLHSNVNIGNSSLHVYVFSKRNILKIESVKIKYFCEGHFKNSEIHELKQQQN